VPGGHLFPFLLSLATCGEHPQCCEERKGGPPANLQSEYVFFSGERVARKDFPGLTVSYYFSDHLKTASVITDATGNIKSESDYYPWGGELQFVNNDSNHYKFTGKERDSETGLDHFGARYYSNGLGRFITPDWAAKATAVPYAEFADPQSLNLYSYVRNVPTTRFDADGHIPQFTQALYQAWESYKQMSTNLTTNALNGWGIVVTGNPNFDINNHSLEQGAELVEGAQRWTTTIALSQIPLESGAGGGVRTDSAEEAVVTQSATREAAGVTANAAKGAAFEKAGVGATKATDTKVAEQLTLKTESGVKTRMDVVSTKASGEVRLQEAKSTATAPLTRNQTAAHPEIAKSGATVVGRGKPDYPGGTKIPPTKVEVVRPGQN
jgi:RHS repeat-associated protein